MTPRQIVSRVAQQSSKALAITALALGLSATVLAPNAALAAPAAGFGAPAAGKGPDLVSGTKAGKKIDVGDSVTIPVFIKNEGEHTAGSGSRSVALAIDVGPGLEPHGFVNTKDDWRCTEFTHHPRGDYSATCYTDPLSPDEARTVGIKVTVQSADEAFIATLADPDNQIPEFDENNNWDSEDLI